MQAAGRARALTMVELLVCLGVLAIALGSVLSIFVAGTRFAARANRRLDAGRVARAVFELADRGFTAEAPHGRGAVDEGRFDVDAANPDEFYSHDLEPCPDFSAAWAPAYLIDSPLPLVWKCSVYKPAAGVYDFDDMFTVEVTVSLDGDENDEFDDPPTDEVVGRWYAVVADRQVP